MYMYVYVYVCMYVCMYVGLRKVYSVLVKTGVCTVRNMQKPTFRYTYIHTFSAFVFVYVSLPMIV